LQLRIACVWLRENSSECEVGLFPFDNFRLQQTLLKIRKYLSFQQIVCWVLFQNLAVKGDGGGLSSKYLSIEDLKREDSEVCKVNGIPRVEQMVDNENPEEGLVM